MDYLCMCVSRLYIFIVCYGLETKLVQSSLLARLLVVSSCVLGSWHLLITFLSHKSSSLSNVSALFVCLSSDGPICLTLVAQIYGL